MNKKCQCGTHATRAVVYKIRQADAFTGQEAYSDERVKWLCGDCPNELQIVDGTHQVVRVQEI